MNHAIKRDFFSEKLKKWLFSSIRFMQIDIDEHRVTEERSSTRALDAETAEYATECRNTQIFITFK